MVTFLYNNTILTMKKFVSVNGKYFKHTSAKGTFGHVKRVFKTNKNVFAEYTKHNFGSDNQLEKYNEIHARREAVCGKKTRKDSNTYIDCAVAFSLDQWEKLERENDPEVVKNIMSRMTRNFMAECRAQLGFEPISFEFHLDEGHKKNELKRNVHAHVQFYNFDFEKKKAPLRKMKKGDFSVFQDIAAKAFKNAGFERGISKEITKKRHLEKDDFIAEKLDKNIIIKQTKLDTLKASIASLYDEFSTNLSKFVENVLNRHSDRLVDDIDDVQNTINNADDKSSIVMTKHANDTAEKVGKKSSTFRPK